MTITAWDESAGRTIPMTVKTSKPPWIRRPTICAAISGVAGPGRAARHQPTPAAGNCLLDSGLTLPEIDVIVAAPARHGYRAPRARDLDVPSERIVVAEDEKMHTASLAAARQRSA